MLCIALAIFASGAVAAAFVAGLWLSDSEWLVASDGHAPVERRDRTFWLADASNPEACARLLRKLEELHGQRESEDLNKRLRERIGPP